MSELSPVVESEVPEVPVVPIALLPAPEVVEAIAAIPAPVESTPAPEAEVAKPVRVKAKRKVAKKVPVKANGRGRPKIYTGKLGQYIASLIRRFGQSGARKVLNAGTGKKDEQLRSLRNLDLVPKALGISLPTLVKVSKDYKIELTRGRYPNGTAPLEKTLAKLEKKAA